VSEALSETLKTIFTIGGGLAGYASFVYLLTKKLRKNFRVYDLGSFYKTKNSQREGFQDVTAKIRLAFLNDSEEGITITDIVGSLRYNKEFFERMTSPINPKRIDEVIVARPTKSEDIVHFTIPPHATIKKEIELVFSSLIIECIDRIGLAHFAGFIDGKTPFLRVDERELKEKWHLHPLIMILSIHVNGKKKHHKLIGLWGNADNISHGSLNMIDIEKIKKDIRDRKDLSKFSD
jgi:hypothetical protein